MPSKVCFVFLEVVIVLLLEENQNCVCFLEMDFVLSREENKIIRSEKPEQKSPVVAQLVRDLGVHEFKSFM